MTSPPPVEVNGVRFEGDFRPAEREFLAAQFSDCRFRLLARSALGERLALVEWEGAPLRGTGPRPLAGSPRLATYVLDSAATGGPAGVAWSGMSLDRVDGPGELASRFPGHFPEARVRQDWRDRLRRGLTDVWPALMLVVATVWVLAVLWSCRPFG